MPAALVIEHEPELATFAVAAFKWFGLDAFSIERVSDAIEILEGSNDIAVVMINDTEEGKESSRGDGRPSNSRSCLLIWTIYAISHPSYL